MRLDIKWIAIILVLFVGAGFELLKLNPNSSMGRTPRLVLNQEIQPYSVSSKDSLGQPNQPTAQAIQPIRNMPMPMIEKTVLPEATATAAAEGTEKKSEDKDKTEKKEDEKKVTEADEYEEVLDEKTGQMVRRKKMTPEEAEKKKKEDEEKLAQQKIEDERQLEEKKRLEKFEQERLAKLAADDRNHNQNLIGGATAPAQVAPAATSGFNALGMSTTDWEKKLLATPDAAATASFVQAFNSGNVTSSNFYRIVDLMLKDSRPEMKSLGVVALGSTPSVGSFNALAGLLKTEASGSALRAKIDEYLNQYMNLTNLDVLETILRASTSAFNVLLAMDKVDSSAQKYLSNKTDPSYARNVVYFKPFINLLETLTKSTDASVVAQAQKTLTDVKSLTSTT